MIGKADLIDAIAEGAGCTKAAAGQAYADLIHKISTSLILEGAVLLPGLGRFTLEPTVVRMGRNPRTGEPVQIRAGYRVKFKAAKALEDKFPKPRQAAAE